MSSYFYKIKHKPTGRFYVGSQYGKNCDPANLLKTYVTSSKYVRALIKETGIDSFEIVKIAVREDARNYEARFLKRSFNMFGKEKFLSLMINRNIAPGILLTDEIIQKANVKRKVSNSIAAKKLVEQGRHNFQTGINAGSLPHVRELNSKRMQGNKLGAQRKLTQKFRNKQADLARGNTNVRGTKWWTNGIVNRRSKECPGEGFYLKAKVNVKKEIEAH